MTQTKNVEIVIKELGSIPLVGFRVICEGDQYPVEIPKSAAILKDRTAEIKNLMNEGNQVGAFVVDAPSEKEDGYWVCVQVSEYCDIPEGMIALTIPSQKYATIIHDGPNYEIMNSYETLHQWIAENQLKRATTKWSLEFYQRPENTPADVLVELCDPIY